MRIRNGTDNDERLFSGPGGTLIFGYGGNDIIVGSRGDDTLDGGAGHDVVYANEGNGILRGGDGNDLVSFASTIAGPPTFFFGVYANLQSGSASALANDFHRFEISGFENIEGSLLDDILIGDETDNMINGLGGGDRIEGAGGNDTLFSGDNDNKLDGGAGDDWLFAGQGDDTLIGGEGSDTADFSKVVSAEYRYLQTISVDLAGAQANIRIGNDFYIQDLSGIENLTGSHLNERLTGDANNNVIRGGGGNDTLKGGAGDDTLSGGDGFDIALYDGRSDHFTIQYDAQLGETFIIDRTGAEGTDTRGTNVLRFADDDFTLLQDGQELNASGALTPDAFEELVELYIAYFNRAPDAAGLAYWARAVSNDTTLDQAAAFFFDQPETRAVYGDAVDPSAFVSAVYTNVLGRAPDSQGLDFWVDALASGGVSEAQFIRSFLQGARPETPSDPREGFTPQQVADRSYLDAKTDIGISFAAIRGMSDMDTATTVMALFDGGNSSIDAAFEAIDTAHADAIATDGSGALLIQFVGLVPDPMTENGF